MKYIKAAVVCVSFIVTLSLYPCQEGPQTFSGAHKDLGVGALACIGTGIAQAGVSVKAAAVSATVAAKSAALAAAPFTPYALVGGVVVGACYGGYALYHRRNQTGLEASLSLSPTE